MEARLGRARVCAGQAVQGVALCPALRRSVLAQISNSMAQISNYMVPHHDGSRWTPIGGEAALAPPASTDPACVRGCVASDFPMEGARLYRGQEPVGKGEIGTLIEKTAPSSPPDIPTTRLLALAAQVQGAPPPLPHTHPPAHTLSLT